MNFFLRQYVIMNEGRLTLELLYALAPAFVQFFPPPRKPPVCPRFPTFFLPPPPMSLQRCLEGLVPVAKALNVVQGLPQNTGRKHGPGKTAGHGLDTSCGLVGPSLTQEHSLRITFCVAWCTMWSNICNCRYHLSHSQLLLATRASLSYVTLSYSTLFSFSHYSTLSYSHQQLLDSC